MAGRTHENPGDEVRAAGRARDGLVKAWPYVRAGDRLGAYRIREFLGRGGMGRVYRADGPDGPVALKLIHPQFLRQEDFLRRFLLEAGAGKRVHHPHVVRTYGCEVVRIGDEEQAMLVMEYVQGRTLMDLSKDIGRVPDGFMRDIARGVVSGIEAIHEAGVIHRDLKPENVMITEDNRIKIMDLGVARLRTEEIRLSRTGHFVGSLLFAAPEQLSDRGIRPGPAADLYAVGLLLHVLASGDHPFPAGTAGEIINAHLNTAPRPLREVAPGCSRFLEGVTETLLAKRPEDRFPSAAALRETLEAGEASEWWLGRRALGPEDGTGSVRLPVRRVGPVRGRPAELRDLGTCWRRTLAGSGRALLITGESGIGKTRVVDAFLEGLRLPRGRVGLAIAESATRPKPAGAVRAALRALTIQLDSGLPATDLPPVVQSFLDSGEVPTSNEDAGRDAFLGAVLEVLLALASTAPRVLVFDDLDRLSVLDQTLFRLLAARVDETGLLLIGMARPDLPPSLLEPLSRMSRLRRLPLRRLENDHAERVIGDMLESTTLAGRLAPELVPLTGGNPLFLTEVVESLKSTEALALDPAGQWRCVQSIGSSPVPASLQALFNQRIDALAPEVRQVLEAAAIHGETFDVGRLATFLDRPVVEVLDQLQALGGDPQMIGGGGENRTFEPALARRVVLDRLADDVRRGLHARWAEIIVRTADDEDGSTRRAPEIARHHLAAGDASAAEPFLRTAVQSLVHAQRHAEALSLLEAAFEDEGVLGVDTVLDLRVEQAHVLGMLGRRDEERRALESLRGYAEARQRPMPGGALEAHGRLLLVDGRLEDAARVFDEQLASAMAASDPIGEARARRNLGSVAFRLGEKPRARQLFERSLILARAAGDRGAQSAAYSSLSVLFESQGDNHRARMHTGRQIALAAQRGDARDAARAHGSLARLARRCGRFREAQVHVDRQLALARQLGDRGAECQALRALGALHTARGRLDAAREALRTAERVAAEAGRELDVASIWVDLGEVHLLCGDERAMLHLAMRALSKAQRLRVPGLLAAALTLAGRAAEESDQLDEARDWYTQALDGCGPGLYVGGEIGPLFGLARVARLMGRPDRAAAPLDQIVRSAETLSLPGPWLVAESMRAAALEQPPRRVLSLLVRYVDRLSVHERFTVHLEMATATGDSLHLEEARSLFDGLVADLGTDPLALAGGYSLYRRIPGCDAAPARARRAS